MAADERTELRPTLYLSGNEGWRINASLQIGHSWMWGTGFVNLFSFLLFNACAGCKGKVKPTVHKRKA